VAAPREFPAVPASLADVRETTRHWAREAGAEPAVVYAATHAVHEAVVNAIVHGYDGGAAEQVVRVAADDRDGCLRFTITDHGAGFLPRQESPGYGLGLAIIAQLSDDFEVHDRPGGGLVVRIGFRLTAV
jgi:anti-sigma regulatory factor (Ser/Thr protein kinase)